MADHDEAEPGRLIAEAISEVFSCLCVIVDADRFGLFSPDHMPPLRLALRQIVELVPDFRGSASPGLDLSTIAQVARELEVVLQGGITFPPNPQVKDLASRFSKAMGCDVFPPG